MKKEYYEKPVSEIERFTVVEIGTNGDDTSVAWPF